MNRIVALTTSLYEIAITVGRALGLGTVVINMYRPEWDDYIVSSVHGNEEARTTLLGSVEHSAGPTPHLRAALSTMMARHCMPASRMIW